MDFLPRNSALIHCIRAYVAYRILVGLTCMTETRLQYLRSALKDYQKYCAVSCLSYYSSLRFMIKSFQEVEQQYGKNFDFLKQHASSHVSQDIREKGTTDNFSTRIGEGFQQEAAQAFEQTNMKNAEHQVSGFDSWRRPKTPKFL